MTSTTGMTNLKVTASGSPAASIVGMQKLIDGMKPIVVFKEVKYSNKFGTGLAHNALYKADPIWPKEYADEQTGEIEQVDVDLLFATTVNLVSLVVCAEYQEFDKKYGHRFVLFDQIPKNARPKKIETGELIMEKVVTYLDEDDNLMFCTTDTTTLYVFDRDETGLAIARKLANMRTRHVYNEVAIDTDKDDCKAIILTDDTLFIAKPVMAAILDVTEEELSNNSSIKKKVRKMVQESNYLIANEKNGAGNWNNASSEAMLKISEDHGQEETQLEKSGFKGNAYRINFPKLFHDFKDIFIDCDLCVMVDKYGIQSKEPEGQGGE